MTGMGKNNSIHKDNYLQALRFWYSVVAAQKNILQVLSVATQNSGVYSQSPSLMDRAVHRDCESLVAAKYLNRRAGMYDSTKEFIYSTCMSGH